MTPNSFAAFYALYPRHVARKAAEKAWARCATSPEIIERIMAGLRAQLPAMLKKDKEFIPHPGTWLNGKRWEDMGISQISHRLIACEKCGDTGVMGRWKVDSDEWHYVRCSCRIGQLPGVLAGVVEAS